LAENRQAVGFGRGFWIATAVLTVVAAGSVYFWYTLPISNALPEAILTARQIDDLFRFMAAVGSALYVFIFGYIVYFAIAFRAKKGDDPNAIGVQVHDNVRLEVLWTILPALFVVLLSIISVKIWYEITLQPANGLVVEAIGHKWYYTFRYPQVHGEITDEMHVPLGVPVTLNVTSSDVIHSFWVPAMRLKTDMVPGMVTTIRFTPVRPGRYQIICTQFCGTQHAEMNKQVFVIEDRPAYDAWFHSWQAKNANASDAVATASTGTVALAGGDAKAGQATFQAKCSACHAIGPYSQRLVGPGLKDVLHDPSHPSLVDGDAATPANVAKILQQGYKGDMGQMPSAQMNAIGDKDIANLVAYLNSLK
jgi:cytochrome c oxidase subunit 2